MTGSWVKVYCLSTAHITLYTRDYLEAGEYPSAMLSWDYGWDYGWWAWVPYDDADYEDMPPDLRACLTYARSQGAEWLRLDADEQAGDDLPTYDWESEPRLVQQARAAAYLAKGDL